MASLPEPDSLIEPQIDFYLDMRRQESRRTGRLASPQSTTLSR